MGEWVAPIIPAPGEAAGGRAAPPARTRAGPQERNELDADAQTAALEAACQEAGPDGPDAGWRARWHAAIAPLSPEEVRAWCRLRWADAPADEAPAALAAFWGVAPVAAHGTVALLGDHALRAHRAGRHRLAAAAVQALADLAMGAAREEPDLRGREAISELARVRAGVRHRGLARRIGQALAAAGAARGLGADDLQDLVVEDGGLAPDGTRTWQAGAHDLYLFLSDDGEVELAIFERATGRALGATPQALAPAHFGVYQEARAVQRAVADALATQKGRLELALETQRTWPLAAWRQVFGAHALMAHLAGRLVWAIGPATAMAEGGRLVDAAGAPVDVSDDAVLRLMHPASDDPAAVRAWRARIVARRLVQPFKQAFREVIRPGPADATAGDLSLHFEGVVTRLRPLASLLRARGWTGLGGVGPGGWVARRELPGAGLAAVLTVRPVGAHREAQRRLVALGRLGFVEPGEGTIARARPLGRVPAVAYSEALRVVALAAAGAAGRAAEGAGRRPQALAEVAIARAELVAALLPQLGLAEVVRLEGTHALVACGGHDFRLDLGGGEVTLDPEGRHVDLDGLERADLPLYIPHEGTDAPSAAVLATLVWLAKFGRACAEKE